jgi:hypothetical protein
MRLHLDYAAIIQVDDAIAVMKHTVIVRNDDDGPIRLHRYTP